MKLRRFFTKRRFLLFLYTFFVLGVGFLISTKLPVNEALAQTSNYWNLQRDGSNNLNFYYTPGGVNPAFQISAAGNATVPNGSLGVGVAPTSKLHVSGGSSAAGMVNFAVTGGTATDKVFRITDTGTDVLTVTREGNLGLGTGTPGQKLDVAGNIQASVYYDRGNPTYYMQPSNISNMNAITTTGNVNAGTYVQAPYFADTTPGYQLDPGGSNRVNYVDADSINSRGSITTDYMFDLTNPQAWQVDPSGVTKLNYLSYVSGGLGGSDARLKDNIQTLTNNSEKIEALRPVSFEWKQNTDLGPLSKGRQIGLIAQEVEPIIPEIVGEVSGGYKGISYGNLTSVLVGAFKEQQAELQKEKEKNDLQDKEIEQLKKEIELLKQLK